MNNYGRFSGRNSARSCKKSCKILQEILQDLARCFTRSCKTSSKILHDNLAPAYARILQDSCTSKQSCKIISGKSCKTCKKVAKLRARLQDSCKSCKMMCKIFYYLAARSCKTFLHGWDAPATSEPLLQPRIPELAYVTVYFSYMYV